MKNYLVYVKENMVTKSCPECWGLGYFWTEWSDKANADPELARRVVMRPNPPDGTVCISCPVCQP